MYRHRNGMYDMKCWIAIFKLRYNSREKNNPDHAQSKLETED